MTKPVITTRLGKGEPLTFSEMDTNLQNLQDATLSVAGDSGVTQSLDLNDTLTIAGGTGISTVAQATDTVVVSINDTAVSTGSYTNANITVDAQGRITAASNGFSGSYNDLTNKPTIPSDVSDLTDTTSLLFDGAYSSLSGTPTIPSDVSDLTDTTSLLFDGAYTSLTGLPSLFSGSYNDLTNKPSIPSDTGDLTNGAGFITTSALSGYATETYVGTAISNLVDSAPGTLDTLNELAAALGDDPNFATTITTSLGNKLEDITGESVGDLSDVDLTGISDGQVLVWDNANSKFIAGSAGSDLGTSSINDLGDVDTTSIAGNDVLMWDMTNSKFIPSSQVSRAVGGGGGGTSGSVTDIDAVRNPQTITLSPAAGISMGDTITFTGTQVTAAGLSTGTTYYIWADVGGGAFEISDNNTTAFNGLTDPGTITDINFSTSSGGGSGPYGLLLNDLGDVSLTTPTSGAVLTYNSGSSSWEAQTPSSSGISSVQEDTNPQLGGNLNGNGNSVSNINLYDYKETIYNLGSNNSPSIDVTNGNVQKVTISGTFNLPTFTNAEQGQSVTLLVTGTGTASGASGYKFAGGETTLTSYSIVSIFYDGTIYWCSINTDFQ